MRSYCLGRIVVGVPVFAWASVSLHLIGSFFRVAQEPSRNRKPEPSESFFPKPKAEPEPPEPFSKNRNGTGTVLSC